MSAPELTVAIPAYDAAGSVGAAIESVRAQEGVNVVIDVAVDPAGPDDRTGEIAYEYAAGDPRVRVTVNPTRLGWVENLGACIARAETPFFAFCFGDDRLLPGHGRTLTAALRSAPGAVAAFGAMRLDRGGRETLVPVASVRADPAARVRAKLAGTDDAYGLKALYRTEVAQALVPMRDIGGVGFHADWPFMLGAALVGEFVAVPEPVYAKTRWGGSVTARWLRIADRLPDLVAEAARAQLDVIAAAPLDAADRRALSEMVIARMSWPLLRAAAEGHLPRADDALYRAVATLVTGAPATGAPDAALAALRRHGVQKFTGLPGALRRLRRRIRPRG
ncbi:MAG: glycosyltransferase family A protein [Pseudomonadota bacterium]